METSAHTVYALTKNYYLKKRKMSYSKKKNLMTLLKQVQYPYTKSQRYTGQEKYSDWKGSVERRLRSQQCTGFMVKRELEKQGELMKTLVEYMDTLISGCPRTTTSGSMDTKDNQQLSSTTLDQAPSTSTSCSDCSTGTQSKCPSREDLQDGVPKKSGSPHLVLQESFIETIPPKNHTKVSTNSREESISFSSSQEMEEKKPKKFIHKIPLMTKKSSKD
ncbi:ORF3 protein [Cattle blood-associated circovirus-like virus]|uniref:ORF3 protein n=1 Tax=Cattle blood-associated circovirus-like virus TaxID=2077298 RepID=A0A2L0HHW4_9VIRU|nr:ORF3 protein [Cattle blood-associated circovirus-like virus]